MNITYVKPTKPPAKIKAYIKERLEADDFESGATLDADGEQRCVTIQSGTVQAGGPGNLRVISHPADKETGEPARQKDYYHFVLEGEVTKAQEEARAKAAEEAADDSGEEATGEEAADDSESVGD